MRNLFLAAAAASFSFAAGAHAAPLLQYEVFDGGTLIGSGSSTTGFITSGAGSDAKFMVSLNATGAPAITAPNFSNNDFTIASNGSAGTLTIKITDTGLVDGLTTVQNTFTTNSLTGGGFTGDTIANYNDNTNAAYGTEYQLASTSYSGLGSFSTGPVSATLNPADPFSETSIYTLTFAAGPVNSSVSASSQIVAVPEPVSLALVGTGLAGLGVLRRRRR